MRILHEETPFSEEEKKHKRDEIKLNVKESIITILNAMPVVDPPVRCADAENEARRAWMLSECAKPDFEYPTQFWEATAALWKDAGVQVIVSHWWHTPVDQGSVIRLGYFRKSLATNFIAKVAKICGDISAILANIPVFTF